MRGFDIEGYVMANLEAAKKSSSGQIVGVCPWCQKPERFYVNASNGHYVCFRCDARGRRLIGFVAEVEGVGYAEAKAFMLRQQVEFRRTETMGTLLERIQELREAKQQVSEASELPDCPMPKGFIPVYRNGQWRHPRYLRQRGFQRETSRKWGLGWCRTGRYAGRIVIPVVCPNGKSFTARDTTGEQEPRYLNPTGVNHGKLLCGWKQAPVKGDLALVEGPLDAMKMWQHGYPAVALMGKQLSVAQASLLFTKPEDAAITILLDPEETTAPCEIANRLIVHFSDVLIARLPAGVDPGASTERQAARAVERAERYRGRVQKLVSVVLSSKQRINGSKTP